VFALAATCRAALAGGVSRLPAALVAALHPDPDRRPTAADLAGALWRAGPGRLPVPPDDAVPAAGPVTVDLPDRPPAPPTARPVRRPGALAAAAAVGALVAAGTVAAWSAGRATAAPEPVAFDPATGVVTTPTARFPVGRPWDAFLVGDWDGDGRPTPALYRPSTGEVLTFTDWPPAAPAEVARAARGGTARVVADGGRDRVEVTPPEDRA
jgi:serine/threonine-protein kinase